MKFLGLYVHGQGVLDQLVIITAAPDPAECIDHSMVYADFCCTGDFLLSTEDYVTLSTLAAILPLAWHDTCLLTDGGQLMHFLSASISG